MRSLEDSSPYGITENQIIETKIIQNLIIDRDLCLANPVCPVYGLIDSVARLLNYFCL